MLTARTTRLAPSALYPVRLASWPRMILTPTALMNPTITEDYPDSPPKFQERYRGAHVLQRDENGLEKCVACFLCAAACPADCIYIEAAENTDANRISAGERYASVYKDFQGTADFQRELGMLLEKKEPARKRTR